MHPKKNLHLTADVGSRRRSVRPGPLGSSSFARLLVAAVLLSNASVAVGATIHLARFELESQNAVDDQSLNKAFRNGIRKALEDRGYDVEAHSQDILNRMERARREAFFKQEAGFVVSSHMEVRSGDQLRVTVTVRDYAQAGAPSEDQWTRGGKADFNDVAVLALTSAKKIRGVVEGVAAIPTLFLYCFLPIDDGLKRHRLIFTLPFDLTTWLEREGLGGQFELVSFDDERALRRECLGDSSDQVSRELYEYRLSGQFRQPTDADSIVVRLRVWSRAKRKGQSLGPAVDAKEAQLVEALVKHIRERLPAVVEESE